ncbi:MAG: hypothetical protein N2321_06590 [Melioribacteraceae bacterium]|nr:hypothetical protein [Melioribacteraceae bacterium]
MILDLIVTKTDDGYFSEVPSLKGCESWAHTEDEVLEKSVELVKFYLKIDDKKIKIDIARKENESKVFKIIFDK